ncbi:hypothetical protein KFE25_001361 [Diacronema lutheri]|uniref:Sulfotransferase n=2 Tax=Diacronema lutheri TaxID=2081491 RepID=A0A8J5XDG3_DIALT|nr:hypothetical protein KFE25_001361 [Diacronema lutheri]
MFLFTSPVTKKSLSMCVGPKCGSTSMFLALYLSIVGRSKPPGRLAVNMFPKWNASGVSFTRATGDVHVHVVRDPIDRYISAFHSKLKCCPGTSGLGCFQDKSETHIAPLLALSGNTSGACCLHMHDYATALNDVHRKGLQAHLDRHFRPQHLMCAVHPGALDLASDRAASSSHVRAAIARSAARGTPLVLRGNVSQLAAPLALLDGYAFKGGPIKLGYAHATPREESSGKYDVTEASWSALCRVSAAEYAALGMRAPDRAGGCCRRGGGRGGGRRQQAPSQPDLGGRVG